ncbi:hypothetical protein RclHR1_29280004 [Rhizophagus clarus]|uniref:RNase H type-1 domain-containing protein n=1 Tax=Rhizophagus clarus TaxID=94130 RepID=A0A2Z6RIQ3_9GLOM|nr:hypothetical protein RclHR1_29280004 [Rhizophagus clarus]
MVLGYSGFPNSHDRLHWLVTLDGNAAPLFGKQLTVQLKKDTCIIVHWTSDCFSSPGDVIRLHLCPGCDAHVPFPAANKYTTIKPRCTFTISLLRSLILPTHNERIRLNTTEVVSPYSWADLCTMVVSYYACLSIPPDFSSSPSVVNGDSTSSPLSRDSPGFPFPVILPPGSHYQYYTDGSLINLGSPEVSMAETAAIFAALSVTPEDSVISLYTDSQAAIDGLRSCASSAYTNSRFYYKTINFELWASIECCIHEKRLSVLPVKIKGHDGNYWNDFADSLANSAHHLPFCLTDRDDYIVDWDLTWFALNYSPSHDASFQAHHASRHYTFKFKLFLDDLPLLEKLKITRLDLYIDLLTCRSCCLRKEDLMHLILCSKRCTTMHQIFQSYQNHLFSKLREASELADVNPLHLSIPRQSAMKVVAAIHNNFIQKLRRRIWNSRTYDKSRWEDAMHITLKLKTTPQPSNLPASTYVPFSSLLPPTYLVTSCDSGTDWIKNLMLQGLPWYNHMSGFMGRLTVLLNNSFCRMGCRFL